jgi:hypothetical protein
VAVDPPAACSVSVLRSPASVSKTATQHKSYADMEAYFARTAKTVTHTYLTDRGTAAHRARSLRHRRQGRGKPSPTTVSAPPPRPPSPSPSPSAHTRCRCPTRTCPTPDDKPNMTPTKPEEEVTGCELKLQDHPLDLFWAYLGDLP